MNLKKYLEHKKKTQSEFAREVGCTDGALSLLISGDRIPSPSMAKRIVRITNGKVGYSDLYETVREYGSPD